MFDEAGAPFDLTGYTGILTIQKTASDPTVLLTMTTGNGRLTFGSNPEEMQLFISAVDTAALTWRSGYYTFLITSPLNVTDIILYGGFSVLG